MRKQLTFACVALAVLQLPDRLCAQFTDARTYVNTPVGVNQLELDYVYSHSDASIDTSLIVVGAKLNLNSGIIYYRRDFSFIHRLAWAKAYVPLAGLNGAVTGINLQGSSTGAGDSSYQFAVLLKGGPALSVTQFSSYRPTTSMGVSLTVTAPTGLYDANKVLNLGSDRWSFKPEIGVSLPFGSSQKWEFDAYANAVFFTGNTSYNGNEILRQEPLPGLEGHISYSFNSILWASLDTRYSFRGNTIVNGINQNDAQQFFTLGTELNISINRKNSLVFVFAKALVHENAPAYTGIAVKYLYSWGKGYK